jgi:ribosomal protein S18 acetylase RimI-like enzyme
MKPTERDWTIDSAGPEEVAFVQGLLDSARWQHRHLDWLQPLELIGRTPFALAMDEGLPVACLACPPDPPGVAWIRLFALASGYDLQSSWAFLWDAIQPQALDAGATQVAALCLPEWLPALLTSSGFAEVDSVEFMAWTPGELPAPPALEGIERRALLPTDLAAVLQVDNEAFDPIWRHSLEALNKALTQAAYATILLDGSSVIGYQISTASAHGGHLARLAVLPSRQGMGAATALLIDALTHFRNRGLPRVTVNTQGNNQPSHALYRKVGFEATGQAFPIYQRSLTSN